MTTRLAPVRRLAPYAAALALALVAPLDAGAQTPAPATAPAAQGEVRDLPLTPAERQRYIGSYTIVTPEGSMVLRIYEEEGVLKGRPEGDDEPSRLLYQGNHTFRPEMNTAMALVFTVDGERATKFVLSREGMSMEGVRNP